MRNLCGMTVKFGRQKKNTIQRKLNEYLKIILIFIIFLSVAAIGFCIMVTLKMANGNEQMMQINYFFDELDDEQSMLYDIALRTGEEHIESLQQNFENLEELLDSVGRAKISVEYQRAIEDLSNLLDGYGELISQVAQGKSDTDTLNESREIYEAMRGYLQPTYQQVLEEKKQFFSQILRMILTYIAFLLVTLILIILYMILKTLEIIRGITNPIQQLTERMCKIDFLNGAISETIPALPEYHEEMNQMICGYNQMMEKNQRQLLEHAELMNTKLLLQKQELLNLQHQINPHFLFNTLNMISHTAYLENDRKVVSLIEITANLLRYSLDYSSREVTLGQEIEAIGNYVSIQERRFEDRIQFEFDLDESFHQMRMPSLILQPLLENAIVHGIGGYEKGGKIWIRTRYDREKKIGYVSVSDNGEGMDEETLRTVKENMQSTDEKVGNIGLANVYFRLKLFFGDKADIQINSVPREKTEIVLVMPYEQDGEKECTK